MTEPNPLQQRAAQLREALLQQQIGQMALTLLGLQAERDALAEQHAQLMAEVKATIANLPTTEGTS